MRNTSVNNEVSTINIESLSDGIPAISAAAVGFYKENCMVCFYHQAHQSGVTLRVDYDDVDHFWAIAWSGEVTPTILKSYADLGRATDFAACAIALLIIREMTDFTAIEQAVRGTTIDYYLGSKSADDTLIFNHLTARLEVSGILQETPTNSVASRVKIKRKRLQSEGDLLDFIVVVEFSKPWAKMVQA